MIRRNKSSHSDIRFEIFRTLVVVGAVIIILRLFVLQIVRHDFYESLASGQHGLFEELIPKRGDILFHDYKDDVVTPIATNEYLGFVWADPREVEDPRLTALALQDVLGLPPDEVDVIETKLRKHDDPYEPIKREVSENLVVQIESLALKGIHVVRELSRLYPEPKLGSHVMGFLSRDDDDSYSGKYGVEGYMNEELTGTAGYIAGERDIAGRLIPVADREYVPALDGSDIVLTIDRTIQYYVCQSLQKSVSKHGADGGSVVIVAPSTGKILAMCSVPDYDPNTYNLVDAIDVYNNPVIFDAYEPGSIFKPLTMASAIDVGAVTATTTFTDMGSVMVEGWHKPIGNAQGKVYGLVDMTTVLEDSINTGMVFAMRQMGKELFVEYVKKFGFGRVTGVELQTEVSGTIASLEKSSEIYSATASFGQGITVTPLQIAMAYAALANGGVLKSPQIIDEIRHADGLVEKRSSRDIAQVITQKTAHMISAMLVSVIEHGHGKRAGVPGYYIAGKTGTAQVARTDGIGYDEDNTVGSFAGFGPVEDPKFAMVVRINNPKDVVWAESTAAPLFGEIAQFLLQYFEIPPVRDVENP